MLGKIIVCCFRFHFYFWLSLTWGLQVPDGTKSIPVGQTIALLAEEGDDISNLEVPKEEASKSSAPKEKKSQEKSNDAAPPPPPTPASQPPDHDIHITSSRPLFPSVQRLLTENGIENADRIKGTGIRGMLTKGDVLAHLGKVSSPAGSYKPPKSVFPEAAATKQKEEQRVRRETLFVLPQLTLGLAVGWACHSSSYRIKPSASFSSLSGDAS